VLTPPVIADPSSIAPPASHQPTPTVQDKIALEVSTNLGAPGNSEAGQVGRIGIGRQIASGFCTLESTAQQVLAPSSARSRFLPDGLGLLPAACTD